MIRAHRAAVLSTACALAALLAVACGSTPAAPTPTPASPAPPSQSRTCQSFAAAGSYTLDRDVPCIAVLAGNIDLDCGQHAVGNPIMNTTGVTNVVLHNCRLSPTSLNGLSSWTIADSTFEGTLMVTGGHGMVFRHDTFEGPASSSNTGYLLYLYSGSGNSVIDSSFDGAYAGQCNQCGADDAILLAEESGDTIQGNTTKNTWDTGIEGAGAITNTIIANNSISNAGTAGIGAFWCTHWQDDQITGNQITASARAMYFEYAVGPQCGPNPATGLFADNTIANNTFRNPVPVPSDGVGLLLLLVHNSPSTGNNVLRGNDMGGLGIDAVPPESFTNGGGNICGSAGTFSC